MKGSNNPRYGKKTDPQQILKAQKIINSKKFICLVTGKVTTLGPLVQWQKKRGIDSSLRMPLSTLFFILEKSCLK
jgi:hypothetical protein